MNKTLLILIAGIVIVGGLIGYTVLGKPASTQQKASEAVPHDDTGTAPHDDSAVAPHDDTGTAPHNDTTTAPHDDTGTAPHND